MAFTGYGAFWIWLALMLVFSGSSNPALAIVFLTLLLGFIGLDVAEIGHMAAAGTFAYYDLIVCAFAALYLGASTVYADSGINLPVGGPWM